MKNQHKVQPDFDCDYTDEIVCPYCGYEQSDNWEFVDEDEECQEYDCQSCEKRFNFTVHKSITFSATCMEGEHEYVVDNWHIEDMMSCKRCGDSKFTRHDD